MLRNEGEITVGGRKIKHIRFADDVVLVAEIATFN